MSEAVPVALLSLSRPRVRSQCESGVRPCPWVSCRHHLAVDLLRDGRVVQVKPHWPGGELADERQGDPEATPWSCVLDLVQSRDLTMGAVEYQLDISRARILQLEEHALEFLYLGFPDLSKLADFRHAFIGADAEVEYT